MTITPVTINASFNAPDGSPLADGTLIFRTRRWDLLGADIVVPDTITAPIVAGAASISAYASADGVKRVGFDVDVEFMSATAGRIIRQSIARDLVIPDAGPVELGALLDDPLIMSNATGFDIRLRQELQDARDQSVASAAASQRWAESAASPDGTSSKSAKSWAGEAAASADRVDLGALDAAVLQAGLYADATAADRLQTGVDRIAAQTAKTDAEAARDAATVNAAVYASTAAAQADAGLAVGAQYQVVSGSEVIRYRKDSGSASTELVRYPTAAAVFRPSWAGLSSAWVDPFFRDVEVGFDYAGRSRWRPPFDGVYTLVNGSIFGSRVLRRSDTSVSQFGGPRLWMDEIGAAPGDTITVRALITGSGVTGGIAIRFFNASDVDVGAQITMTQPSGSGVVVTSGTPVLLTGEVVIPAGATGARVYSYVSSGTGTIDVQALWACRGTAVSTPSWPIFGGDPGAHAAAYNAADALRPVTGRLGVVEGGQAYLLDSAGAVEPAVQPSNIQLPVTNVIADSTYGAVFRGWAERYTPAGVSFNAVRIRSLGRKSDVAEANFWRKIKIVVRSAASANAHLGASSTLVAVGEALVNPEQAVLEDVVVILRDPTTGNVVTLDNSRLGAEYLIGTYFENATGGAAYGSPHRGTLSNALGAPRSYWVTTQDPQSGDWQAFAANWRLGVDHLLLTNPVDTVVYSPSAGFLADVGGGSTASVPDVFNASALRQYAKRITAGEAVVAAILGDSWTNGGYRIHTPLRDRINAAYGISAPGWISANLSTMVAAGGTRSRPGTWTDVRAVPEAVGPDNCHSSTTDTSAYITFGSTGTVAKFFLHYLQQPGGGQFSWSVSGGAATVVATDGALSYRVLEISGPGLLRVDIDTAGSAGVLIAGCDVRNDTAGQFVLHKMGASGAAASDFADMAAGYLEAGYAAVAPDVVMICLGTNDHAGSVGLNAYRASIERIIDRIKTAAPLADIVLVGPGPNGNTGSYQIDDYIAALYKIAAQRDLAFVNLKASLGAYAEANARGLYEDPSHPNAAGGQIIGRALWRGLLKE